MTYREPLIHRDAWPRPWPHAIHAALNAFPVACLALTPLTDLAYVQTTNLMWLHFSEWLLLVGVTGAVISLALRVVLHLTRRLRLWWPVAVARLAVILLATVNNLVHTVDGWPAVVPWGMTLSLATLAVMLVGGLLDRHAEREVQHHA